MDQLKQQIQDLKKELDDLAKQMKDVKNSTEGKGGLFIGQQDLMPQSVKNRHLGEPNSYVYTGLEASKPTTGVAIGTIGVSIYFAYDTNKLYIWNKTAWKSVTLS